MDEEEMITLDNVMSVDLAIKRELEYRRKTELWKIQNQGNNWRSFFPLQEEPFPGEASLKRKEPASVDLSMLQPSSSQHPNSALVCEVCKLGFATLFHIKQHCDGMRHKSKLFHMKRRGVTISNPIKCELCKCQCSGIYVLEQHLKGIKHISALESLQKLKHARQRF